MGGSGRRQMIPIGPGLVESLGGRCIDINLNAREHNAANRGLDRVDEYAFA